MIDASISTIHLYCARVFQKEQVRLLHIYSFVQPIVFNVSEVRKVRLGVRIKSCPPHSFILLKFGGKNLFSCIDRVRRSFIGTLESTPNQFHLSLSVVRRDLNSFLVFWICIAPSVPSFIEDEVFYLVSKIISVRKLSRLSNLRLSSK